MRVEKGVMFHHPVNLSSRNKCEYPSLNQDEKYFSKNSQNKVFLYRLNDGKFIFYLGRTITANSLCQDQENKYRFRTSTGTTLDLTLEEAKLESQQNINLSRLYFAIKEELSRKRRKSLSEDRVIELGAEITSKGYNVELYGERDRRMVAKGLLFKLIAGEVVKEDVLGKVILT